MTQPTLFAEPRLVRSPICCRPQHCGSKAVLSEPVDLGRCINTDVRCLSCGATGVQSEAKPEA